MGASSTKGGTGPPRGYAARGGVLIRVALTILVLALAAVPAQADGPFVGVGPFDPDAARDRDVGRLARFDGLGRAYAATMPVAWGALEPSRGGTGAPTYRWKALDEAVLVWQLAGLDPVLVLSPRSPWAGVAREQSAWHASVRKVLPKADCRGALRGATGATPPAAANWGRWQRFVRDVVERYDGDGARDMPGLRRAVRHVQILDGLDPTRWLGGDEALLRLLHHAVEGARTASADCRILSPTLDLRATGHAPFPDEREWTFRIDRITPSSAQPLPRLETIRHFRQARRLLGMPRLYDILCHAGSEHLGDDVANLTFLRRSLDRAGAGSKGLWLVDNPMRKLGAARDPGVVAPKRDELRLRRRWLPPALNPKHAQHGRALAWLRRGQAYDLVRTLGRARASGADGILFLSPWDSLPPTHPRHATGARMGLLADVGAGAQRTLRRTPAWYALAQANRLLAGHRAAVETPIGAPGQSVIFQFDRDETRPWVALLLLDPRLSWAGEPGQALPLRDVLITVPRGTYVVESIQTSEREPRRTEVESDGALTLQLGPEPVYLIPKR